MNANNKFNITRIVTGISLIALLYVLFVAGKYICSKRPVTLDGGFRPVMGTFAHVIAVADNSAIAEKSVEAAFDQLVLIDNMMSDYKTDSELSRVNREAFKDAVKISEPLFEILSRSLAFSRKTGGAFDITVGPLVDLFHTAGKKGVPPTKDEIEQAKSRTGFEKLILDGQNKTVKFAVDGMRLDLGAIAKGYAIDRAVEAMRNCGAVGGLVDAGGDICVFGTPSHGKKAWLVGVQDPNKADDTANAAGPLLVLRMTEGAVVTSGDYRRFTMIGGKKYSHIIDVRSGADSRNFTSVTVIAPNAADADALATAVSIMGIQKGLELIKNTPQAEVILISSQESGKIIKTDGVDKYLVTF